MYNVFKVSIDRTVALVLLVLLMPVLVMLALLVKASSPGPVIFRQRRVGLHGREFIMFKFRSMRCGGETFTPVDGLCPGGVEGTDRRTWVGKLLRATSLDEAPQFWNVLRGDMSLVGPRPERAAYLALYNCTERHTVKPGITGWAQVNGLRGQTSIIDRVRHDLYYVSHPSGLFDLRIVGLTVVEVLRFRG